MSAKKQILLSSKKSSFGGYFVYGRGNKGSKKSRHERWKEGLMLRIPLWYHNSCSRRDYNETCVHSYGIRPPIFLFIRSFFSMIASFHFFHGRIAVFQCDFLGKKYAKKGQAEGAGSPMMYSISPTVFLFRNQQNINSVYGTFFA